tara:strand:+ start:5467 stop:6180 length:714 start_codon:yes stop_codon:yes gene_type:complete
MVQKIKILRLHDTIYYNNKNTKKTKESFKFLYNIIDKKKINSNTKILDVGCGDGNLIYYLNKKLPKVSITAIDVDDKILSIVRNNTSKNNKIIKYDINKKDQKIIGKFDIIVAAGVMAIFDDPNIFFKNIFNNLKKNGCLYLFGNFTDYPFNIFIKYEDIKKLKGVHQSGFNVYSTQYLKKKFPRKKITTYPFFINKKIKKNNKDLIRSWTENHNGKKYFINALGFYQNQMWLKINN